MNFEKLADDFIHTLPSKTYTKVDLYDLLLDYLEEKGIFYSEDEENDLDTLVFSKASKLGYLDAKVILAFDDMLKFENKMGDLFKKNEGVFFLITHEPQNEHNLSFSEIWKKWKGIPPQGWIANWCSCGHFYPCSFDIGAMDMENETIIENTFYKPRVIATEDIEKVNFCSDGQFRLILKTGEVFAVKSFILSKNIAISFSDNPADIFKMELL